MTNAPPPPPPGGMPPSGPYGYGYAPQPAPEHPEGTKILVLGILSLVCCSLLGPVALVMGNRVRKEIETSPNNYSNTGLVTAGWICGIIGTVLLALTVLYLIFIFVVVGASSV